MIGGFVGMYQKKHKYAKVLFIIIAICLVGIISKPTYALGKTTKVLLLNSYHSDFTWTKDMTESILSGLKDSELDVTVYTEYMDWKNFPIDENINNLYTTYKNKYRNENIELIITTDDKALEFALENRQELFANAPIVFAGINEVGEQRLIHGEQNVTGVMEHIDLKETIDMAYLMNPNMKELYVIHDQTESGQSEYNIVENMIASISNDTKVVSVSNRSNEGIIEVIKGLGENSSVLIVTYYQDIFRKAIDFEVLTEIVSRESKVPVFHMYALTMGHGNIGGAMLCARSHGEVAGQLGLRILNGEKADELPVIRDTPLRLAFDYEQLEEFKIPMKVIPKEAEILNKPFSFFETYKQLVILWFIILSLLVVLIIGLMVYIKAMRKIRIRLQENNEEITQGYEELTASDEELQQQLEEINEIESRLRRMAYYDTLTNMPNKRKLQEDLGICIAQKNEENGAIIFIDTDNFKLINDTMGHSIGDKLLVEIGKQLEKLTSNMVKVYRMGGDEFLLLIKGVKGKNAVKKIADKAMAAFEKGFLIENMMLHTTVSAGVAMYPDHGETSESLIMSAEIAMYKAKENGKDRYVIYNDTMNLEIVERASIEINLRIGIEEEEFLLYYQPQYDFKNKKMIGFEALIRWDSAELGWMSPFKFIQIAEDSRMIIPIGRWVLETACKFIKKVHELGWPNYTMAVNISAIQVMQEDFVEMILQTLTKNDLEPRHLELEMTETMLIENFDVVVEKLETLRKFGIKIALDDFGTGYSSLNYLYRLPIDTLKLDKSFIDRIFQNGEDKAVTNVLIILGHRMGLKVIAEGVETQQEFDYLYKHGCDYMQGYLFSKPLREAEIFKLLDKNNKV